MFERLRQRLNPPFPPPPILPWLEDPGPCRKVGRPRLDVDAEVYRVLRKIGKSNQAIADVMGVNLSTLRRRLREWAFAEAP